MRCGDVYPHALMFGALRGHVGLPQVCSEVGGQMQPIGVCTGTAGRLYDGYSYLWKLGLQAGHPPGLGIEQPQTPMSFSCW